jgi:serine/threonine protein kinase
MSGVPARDAETIEPPSLPGYRFVRNVGAGGNAQVYLYEQSLPRRNVAVKVLNDSALSEAARRRFITEANVTAGLAHRHIVQVFEAKVTDDGRPYIVMPYYPQPNLSVRARRAHFSVADVLRIGIQVGSAVETSHRSGVLHRDIKPQNILTDSYGEPVLTDFGIATTQGGDGPEGLSVPWSPPEIIFGTAAGDQRADVYSLGATLWHLLAGRSPFEMPGDNGTLALMGRIKSDAPPRTQRADVPDSLERLLRQAMAKDPAARPQSAMELIRGLQAVEQELRLPLTQPTLVSDEPTGDTQGSDTISLPPGRGGEDTFTHGFSPRPGRPRLAGPPLGDRGPAGPWPPAAGPGPADDNDKATLKRSPVRIDPRGPAGPPPGQPTADPWASGPVPGSGRVRQFPREAPEAATMARSPGAAPGGPGFPGMATPGEFGRPGTRSGHAAAGPPGTAVPRPPERARGRVLALAGAAAALAVVAGGAVAVLSHGGGQPGGAPASNPPATGAGQAQNALGEGAPGTPAIKATRLSATQVRFTWTYQGGVATDDFEWGLTGTVRNSSGDTTKPELVVTVPSGELACLTVRARNAEGTESDVSQRVCWP